MRTLALCCRRQHRSGDGLDGRRSAFASMRTPKGTDSSASPPPNEHQIAQIGSLSKSLPCSQPALFYFASLRPMEHLPFSTLWSNGRSFLIRWLLLLLIEGSTCGLPLSSLALFNLVVVSEGTRRPMVDRERLKVSWRRLKLFNDISGQEMANHHTGLLVHLGFQKLVEIGIERRSSRIYDGGRMTDEKLAVG